MQNDFLEPTGLFGQNCYKLEPLKISKKISDIVDIFRNNGLLIIWTKFVLKNFKKSDKKVIAKLPFEEQTYIGDKKYCCDEYGYDFYADIKLSISNRDIILEKYWYSAFKNTNLDQLLKGNNIQTTFICGITKDYCVYSTSLSAYKLGYNVVVISDCIKEDYDSDNFDKFVPFSYIVDSYMIKKLKYL